MVQNDGTAMMHNTEYQQTLGWTFEQWKYDTVTKCYHGINISIKYRGH